MKKILGLGNALTDILLQVSDEDLASLRLPKGGMYHINIETMRQIQEHFQSVRKSMVAGGSVSNTINAIACLGGHGTFIGQLGNDEVGEFFRQDMQKNGANARVLTADDHSGCCTVLITPDGERTFATYLGAATLKADDLTPEMFENHDIFHIEGYLVSDHDLILKALRMAKEAGMEISLDLSSFNVVEENRDFLHEIVDEYVDIVFANEEESRAYTHLSPEASVEEIARHCKIAVVKIGKHGSYVQAGHERALIPAVGTKCVDSTGAGDLYAAGFLYGYANGVDMRHCAAMGTLCAGRVCEVVGTKLTTDKWQEIKGLCALMQTLR